LSHPWSAGAVPSLRGGVYNRMGNKERAMQDARRACDMKFDKACAVLVEPGR
jgi:hypothetical protein